MTPPFRIGNLGELAIRCRDYAAMQGFYRDVLGLEFLAEPVPGICFFAMAPGYLGHTQVLALFAPDAAVPQTGEGSSLHHLALGIAAEDQEVALNWLISNGFEAEFQEFTWIGWRGLFTADPDGNTVELVAYVGKSAP
jgi:catechol 2,3-dioxygenase-like lactoylglutathione lyase family enzyme